MSDLYNPLADEFGSTPFNFTEMQAEVNGPELTRRDGTKCSMRQLYEERLAAQSKAVVLALSVWLRHDGTCASSARVRGSCTCGLHEVIVRLGGAN